MTMDKATEEKMTDQDLQIIKAKLEADRLCDCPDCRDKREMVREIERLWEALTHRPVVEAKPQGEAIKDAFMEGIAVYELGEIDGEPMSYESKEKCWEMSDAKNLFNPQVTTDNGEKVKE